ELRAALDRTALSRVAPLKVNRNLSSGRLQAILWALCGRVRLSPTSARLSSYFRSYLTGRRQISRSAVKGEFQATVRSATSTLPFVSGLNSTATRKMAKPTTVVTRIGPDRPIWWVVAYKISSGEISPPKIALRRKQKAT